MLGVCLCVFGASIAIIAGLLYYLSVPVPVGFKQRTKIWFLSTFINAFGALGGLVEWLGIADRLAIMKKMKPKTKYFITELLTLVQTEDTEFDGVKVRIFIPNSIQNQTNRPGIVYIHGGGWVLTDVNAYDEFTRKAANDVGAVLVSIEYRRAPDHPFPVPFEDCLTATKYFLRNLAQYDVDPNAVAIMGDSAGGNLAAAVALQLRDEKFTPALRAQALIYPVTQTLDFSLPSYQQNARGPLLSIEMMAAFVGQYVLGHDGASYDVTHKIAHSKHAAADVKRDLAQSKLSRRRLPEASRSPVDTQQPLLDPSEKGDEKLWNMMKDTLLDQRHAPLLADDMRDLPAAFVLTAQYDILRDEGIMYAQRLEAAGNEVAWCHSTACHGMMMMALLTSEPEVQRCYQEMIDFVKKKIVSQ